MVQDIGGGKMNKQQAREEALKIINEYVSKTIEIEKEAKKNGTWEKGFDANKKLFIDAQQERNKKLRRLSSMVDK